MSSCWTFPALISSTYLCFYLTLRAYLSSYKNSHTISSNVVSTVACWLYLSTKSLPLIIGYYWYDLLLTLINRNMLMVAHHTITLYAITICSSSVEYDVMLQLLYSMKYADIFLHQASIVAELSKNIRSSLWQLITTSLTIWLWLNYRIYASIKYISYLSWSSVIILIMILVSNIFWVIKLTKKVKILFVNIVTEINKEINLYFDKMKYRFDYNLDT